MSPEVKRGRQGNVRHRRQNCVRRALRPVRTHGDVLRKEKQDNGCAYTNERDRNGELINQIDVGRGSTGALDSHDEMKPRAVRRKTSPSKHLVPLLLYPVSSQTIYVSDTCVDVDVEDVYHIGTICLVCALTKHLYCSLGTVCLGVFVLPGFWLNLPHYRIIGVCLCDHGLQWIK